MKVTKDGSQFFEIDPDVDVNTGIDRSLEAAKKKGYRQVQDVTKDGTTIHTIDVTPDSLRAAEQKGYKPVEQFKNIQAAKDEDVNEGDTDPYGTMSTAAKFGSAKMLTGGAAPQIYGAVKHPLGALKAIGPYDESDEDVSKYVGSREGYKKQQEKAFEQHPVQYGAGAITGLGLGAKGMPAANTFKSGAALGATQGLTGGEADLAKGEYGKAALETGAGGLFGGLAGKYGSQFVDWLANKANLKGAGEALGEAANVNAVKALNPTKTQMEKLQEQGKIQDLGELLNKDVLQGKLMSPKSISENFKQQRKNVGAQIGDVYKAADETKNVMYAGELEDALNSIKDKYASGTTAKRDLVPIIDEQIAKIKSAYGQEPMTFRQVADEVSDLQTKAFDKANPKMVDDLRRDAAMAARKTLSNKVTEATGEDTINELNRQYGLLKTGSKIAAGSAAGAKSNRAFGLQENLWGGAGAAAGGATAGPAGAAIGAGIGAGASKLLKTYGRSALAGGQNKAGLYATMLAKELENGMPLNTAISKAVQLGLPQEVIQGMEKLINSGGQ